VSSVSTSGYSGKKKETPESGVWLRQNLSVAKRFCPVVF